MLPTMVVLDTRVDSGLRVPVILGAIAKKIALHTQRTLTTLPVEVTLTRDTLAAATLLSVTLLPHLTNSTRLTPTTDRRSEVEKGTRCPS